MTTAIVGGPKWMEGGQDADGPRTYNYVVEVEGDLNDGPANVLQTPGLPLPGAFWLVRNDIDIWAWCRFDTTVTPVVRDAPNRFWRVGKIFSTKPPGRGGPAGGGLGGKGPGGGKDGASRQKCGDVRIEDPLLEPPRVSGGYQTVMREITHDRFGIQITNSAFQQIRGSQVEFEECQDVVNIEITVPVLNLALLRSLNNTVNDDELWGFPARCIRLRVKGWDRKYHGICFFYYTIQLEFHINTKLDPETGEVVSGWDRQLLDEGSKALNGYWNGRTWTFRNIYDDSLGDLGPPNMLYQSDYDEALDKAGNPTTVILNGFGFPYNPDDADRDFYWSYQSGGSAQPFQGTYAEVLAIVQGILEEPPEGAIIAGPFLSETQMNDAISTGLDFYRNVIPLGFPVQGTVSVEYYNESDFLILPIPLTF